MEKRVSFEVFQSVKRVAQACNPLMMKRENIKAKIAKLAEEYKDYDVQIQSLEAGIKQITGYRVEELVKKVTEAGKTAKYMPTDLVRYDAEKKQYVIGSEDIPTTENVAGSNFDIDAEQAASEESTENEEETVF